VNQKKRIEASDVSSDRRREPRFSIGVPAIIRRGGDAYPATTLNICAGGVLLKLAEVSPFKVDDRVVCEIALTDIPEQAFASWGVGRVVRVEETRTAVELKSGIFPIRS
jgi:hypothetical protein